MNNGLWTFRGDYASIELRDCLDNGVECRVQSINPRVNVTQGAYSGHTRIYRISSAGSQTARLNALHPSDGSILATTTIDFQVTTPSRPSYNIRIPVLETTAMQYGSLIGAPGVPLTTREIGVARPIFGSSIRYEDVRVVVSSVAAAPTTMGNSIRTTERDIADHILIHEMAHIWQYQTGGGGYLSNAACAQVIAMLSAGTRNAAYAYEPKGDFNSFNAEQQAHVIEDYFQMPNLRSDPWYMEVMAQVRRATPTTTTQSAYQESLYGRQHQNLWRTGDPTSPNTINPTSVVPLLRVEF